MRLYFAISRDLRLAALFLWTIPFPATRSSMLIASPTAVAATSWSPARIAISAFLTNVRAADRYGRFRCRRRSATRIRFFADLLLANLTFPSVISASTLDIPSNGYSAAARGWYQTSPARTRNRAHPVASQ